MTVIEENANPKRPRREEKLKVNLSPNSVPAFLPLQNGGVRRHEPYIIHGLHCPWTKSSGVWHGHRWLLALLPTAGAHLVAGARQSPAQSLTQTLNLFSEQLWHLGKNSRRIFTVTWFWKAQLFRSWVFEVKSSCEWWVWGLISHQGLYAMLCTCAFELLTDMFWMWALLLLWWFAIYFPRRHEWGPTAPGRPRAVSPEGSLTGWWEAIYKPSLPPGTLPPPHFLPLCSMDTHNLTFDYKKWNHSPTSPVSSLDGPDAG